MADHAVTWTAIAYAAVQQTPFSTEIPFDSEPTVTDDEIVWAIRGSACPNRLVHQELIASR